MKAFGYTDVRMFFIPFFGAAVSGKAAGVPAWKQALVLLAGPAPGIVAASLALGLGLTGGRPVVATAAAMLLVVNLFNLLPIVPFDGGKLFELVAFGRSAVVEVATAGISAVGLFVLAILFGSVVLGVLGLMVLASLPGRARAIASARAFRAEVPAPTVRVDDAPDAELRALYRACLRPGFASHPNGAEALAAAMRAIHDRALTVRPGLVASLGALGGYAAIVALGAFAALPTISLMAASNALDRETKLDSLTIRYPSSFNLSREGPNLVLERGPEAVVVFSSAIENDEALEAALKTGGMTLMWAAPPVAGERPVYTRGSCAGSEGPRASWRGEMNGVRVTVVICAVTHDRRTYAIAAVKPESIQSDRLAARQIMNAAHF